MRRARTKIPRKPSLLSLNDEHFYYRRRIVGPTQVFTRRCQPVRWPGVLACYKLVGIQLVFGTEAGYPRLSSAV